MAKLPPPFAIKLVQWSWVRLQGIADKLMPPPVRVMLLAGGVMKAFSLSAAARLGIADLLASGPMSVADLAKATSTDADPLYRLMRALAGEGIFRELDGRRFETTPMGRALEADSETSVRPLLLLASDETWIQAWKALPHSLRTGETAFDHAFGQGYFDYLAAHPEAGELFNSWMTRAAELNRPAIEGMFAALQTGRVVDVGGGQGSLINTVLSANRDLTGVLFDRPEVVATAHLDEGIAGRCEIVGGSFFESVPGGGDVYVLQQIIHDWGDDECLEILRHCREAMNDGGRLFIIDAVIGEANEPDFNKFIDLHMLVLNRGGRERTAAEFRDLVSRAGFSVTRILPTPSPFHLIEAEKRAD